MRAVIVIPARLESTRLPNKLLLAESGKPLICHTVERAAQICAMADCFVEVIAAADDERIVAAVAEHARKTGVAVRAVMTDPGHQSGSDRIAEVARSLPPDIDAVLNLQGDEPEIPAAAVLELAKYFSAVRPDIATLVYPIQPADRANPALVKAVLGTSGRALYFSRADIPYRRDEGAFSPPSYGHVGVYLYGRAALERFVELPAGVLERTEKLEQLRALENGMSIYAHILSQRPPKGIDTREDYEDFLRALRG